MIDFEKMLDLTPEKCDQIKDNIEKTEYLRDVVISIERALCCAHEGGSHGAVAVLSAIAALLNEVVGE